MTAFFHLSLDGLPFPLLPFSFQHRRPARNIEWLSWCFLFYQLLIHLWSASIGFRDLKKFNGCASRLNTQASLAPLGTISIAAPLISLLIATICVCLAIDNLWSFSSSKTQQWAHPIRPDNCLELPLSLVHLLIIAMADMSCSSARLCLSGVNHRRRKTSRRWNRCSFGLFAPEEDVYLEAYSNMHYRRSHTNAARLLYASCHDSSSRLSSCR